MTPRRYGPLASVPITRRPKLTWPGGARVALWVNPNIEFFGLDDVMPGNLNERVPREQAKIPNVRNWAVRDYGNRVGIWRIMEVLTRYGIRASAALNSEVCDHHPEIIEGGWLFARPGRRDDLGLYRSDGRADVQQGHLRALPPASGGTQGETRAAEAMTNGFWSGQYSGGALRRHHPGKARALVSERTF
jgi:hypothetical protein